MSAADYDSALLYYSYSLDGGNTFGPREAWPDSDTLTGSYSDTFILDIAVPAGATPQVVVRAYNMYDFYSNSNSYNSPQVFYNNVSQKTSADVIGSAGAVSGKPEGISANNSVQQVISKEDISKEEISKEEISKEEIGAELRDENQNILMIPVDAAIEETSAKSQFSLVKLILACLLSLVLLSVVIFIFQSLADRNRRKR